MGCVSLRWVLSSDQCCFDMRSERIEISVGKVGIGGLRYEEEKGLIRVCLFLGKTMNFPFISFPEKVLGFGCIKM